MGRTIRSQAIDIDLLKYETELWPTYRHIAGVDEAGRGPLAGPVVAAAVILPIGLTETFGINDSKLLSAVKRKNLKTIIENNAVSISVGVIEHHDIDRLNILQATYAAMRQAVQALKPLPEFVLVDGNRDPQLGFTGRCVVKGDSLSLSIAAASIIAKVTRDELMIRYAETYPDYGFERHKGYPTPEHIARIQKFGLSPIHRRSFKPKALEG